MSRDYMTRLDWTIVGWRDGVKFVVLASDQLSKAEINAHYEMEQSELFGMLVREPMLAWYEITVTTRQSWYGDDTALIIMTWGDSYEEALRKLFDAWGPRTPSTRALPAGETGEIKAIGPLP